MERIGCFAGILIFICVTALILVTDIGDMKYTTTFSDTGLTISKNETSFHPGTLSTGGTTVTHTDTNISNKNIETGNTQFEFNDREINNQEINYKNQANKYTETNINHKTQSILTPTDLQNLKAGLKSKSANSNSASFNNNNPEVEQINTKISEDKYIYKNIDWSVWRSNFINRITEDSFLISELNEYPKGTLFHYSFTVDATGKIYNIKVHSLNITERDKRKIAELIKSYQYKQITVFPENSKRQTANVSAILIFADETEYSTPSDFHDLEQVKLKF